MPERRKQVRELIPRGEIDPQAAPVDPFVQPEIEVAPQSNLAGQLAESLGILQPIADEAAEEERERQRAEAEAEARKAAIQTKASMTKFKDAQRQGLFEAGDNPFLENAWKRQRTRAALREIELGLRTAYAESGVKDAEDPQAVVEFANQYITEQLPQFELDTSDETVALTLSKMMDSATNTLVNRHIEARVARIESGVIQAHADEVSDYIDQALTQQSRTSQGVSLDTTGLASIISDTTDDAVASGLPGSKANLATTDAIVGAAIRARNTKVLDLLDKVTTNGGHILGGTARAKEARDAAELKIANLIQQEEAAEDQRTKERKKEQSEGLRSEITVALLDDPGADVDDLLRALGSVDPSKVSSVLSLRSTLLQGDGSGELSPQEFADAQADIRASDDPLGVVTRLAGQGASKSDVKALSSYAHRQREDRPVLSNPFYKRSVKSFSAQIAASFADTLTGRPNAEGLQRIADFETWIADFVAINRDDWIDGDGVLNEPLMRSAIQEELWRLRKVSGLFGSNTGVSEGGLGASQVTPLSLSGSPQVTQANLFDALDGAQ